MEEVEFCGHILRQGKRSPAPGKLLPIQKWEIPHCVTALRGFLGMTNYFSEYVKGYAEKAGPLMEKLKLPRWVGKKGSTFALHWTEEEVKAFESVKPGLAASLELFQIDPDQPFRLRCDASDHAIGAELSGNMRVNGCLWLFIVENWRGARKTEPPEKRKLMR